MRRRGDFARGNARRGLGGPPFSPFVSQSADLRARRPGLRLAFTLLFLLIVAGGAVAVVASATTAGPPASAPSPAPQAVLASPLVKPPVAPPHPNLSIDRVLAYTPWVRGGVPRHPVIALTFDDGPSPYTPQIVAVLTRLHVTATFFIVGQELQFFAAGLRDEVRHGFAIGDHTQNHPPLVALSRTLQYFQIDSDATRIAHLGAPFPRLFRPPYGVFNAQTLAILHRLHMLMVMWSVDPRDWARPGTAAIIGRVLAAARPGAIVELHDGGGNRGETVAALPAIIAGLRRRHYQFETVPQLLALDPPPHHQPLPHLTE